MTCATPRRRARQSTGDQRHPLALSRALLEEVTMSAQDTGKKLVAFCKAGQNIESVKTLYADDVQSIEAVERGGLSP
jgi:hypothetical protein